ncbi:hypothetical protein BS47DRAFT_1344870 [Hydnum rufescens UP504]|uniref:Catalase core domain-containing protein n=1 Tax=Hydnum rufescens UP504 TaxID=1448309 RepID=A0A9P6AVR4_9AGAM|nr:hypothetical protein BS47DRAFT_1344870 [Hydnum rufescens UP504]
MPLPTNENVIALSQDLIAQLQSQFGKNPGLLLLTGTFIPSPSAPTLSSAPHFNQSSTPVTVRFSSSTGVPLIPTTIPPPILVLFPSDSILETVHSVDGFPIRTGEEFLGLSRAIAASPPGGPSPSPIQTFLAAHPAAHRYVATPKPSPSSLAREAYFGVHAYKFTNKDGKAQFARYRIAPDAGVDHLDTATTKTKDSDFLYNELNTRISQGPVSFHLLAQIAEDEDTLDDATVSWPDNRQVLDLGKITLNAFVKDNDKEQKHIIFDPVPRVQGIEPSDDPLLELRAAIYLISGRQRREA